jgi:4-hydroxy-tetrahydrodipicolinate synthase
MDTVPKFIQLIKQVQQETMTGFARVRPPRLELVGEELAATKAAVAFAQGNRPAVARESTAFPG